jgi:hypothetical protein
MVAMQTIRVPILLHLAAVSLGTAGSTSSIAVRIVRASVNFRRLPYLPSTHAAGWRPALCALILNIHAAASMATAGTTSNIAVMDVRVNVIVEVRLLFPLQGLHSCFLGGGRF